jgi:hypothetical protein
VSAVAWSAVAVAVRVAWLRAVPPAVAWDGIIYERTARRIAQGMGFVDTYNNLPPYAPTAFYPVGYPALLGAAHAALGPGLWVPGALNVAAAAVTAAAVFSLARRAAGAPAAHLAAGLYALSPGAVLYASTLMTETVSAALLVVAVALAERYARERRGALAVAAGLVFGVAGLVRPQTLALAPLVALLASPSPGWASRARTLALVGVACAAVVLPWTARNCRALDGCALVSVNGGSNLFIGADPDAGGNYRPLRRGEGCGPVLAEVAKDRCYGRLAARRIAEHPLRWAALMPAKLQALLDYETAPAAYLREAGALSPEAASRAERWLTAFHRLVCALALIALLARARPLPRASRLCVGAVAGSLAVHAVFFGGDRYHMVFLPLLAVLAGGVLRTEPDA